MELIELILESAFDKIDVAGYILPFLQAIFLGILIGLVAGIIVFIVISKTIFNGISKGLVLALHIIAFIFVVGLAPVIGGAIGLKHGLLVTNEKLFSDITKTSEEYIKKNSKYLSQNIDLDEMVKANNKLAKNLGNLSKTIKTNSLKSIIEKNTDSEEVEIPLIASVAYNITLRSSASSFLSNADVRLGSLEGNMSVERYDEESGKKVKELDLARGVRKTLEGIKLAIAFGIRMEMNRIIIFFSGVLGIFLVVTILVLIPVQISHSKKADEAKA